MALQRQLERARTKNFTRNFFIPECQFRAILTEESIQKSIRQIKETLLEVDKKEECIRSILSDGQRTYAILILISCEPLIYKLIEHDMRGEDRSLDSRLPWNEEELNPIFSSEPGAAQRFVEKQWELLAPIFKRGCRHAVFPNTMYLPFLHEEDMDSGGFGDVFKATLPAGHQELLSTNDEVSL